MPGHLHSREFTLELAGQINAGLHPTARLFWEHAVVPKGPPWARSPTPGGLIGRDLPRPHAHQRPGWLFT